MKTKEFKAFWNEDGSVSEVAPKWVKIRDDIRRNDFPTYYSETPDTFAEEVKKAIEGLDKLKHQKNGPAYLGDDPFGPYYKDVLGARLFPNRESVREVIKRSIKLFNGLPNWNHPVTMPNVIPPANIASIIAAMMTDVFSPNIIDGEYAWNVEVSELESAAILASLIGWDVEKAGGLYTFGGSGCYLYGLKYALTRVLGEDSRKTGIRKDAKVLVSQEGHYCMLNSTDWSGIGMDNIITIETDVNTNAMDIEDLEKVIKDLYRYRIPIAAIICTMGTTDAFAIDPVAKARELIDKYPNPKGYGKTLLYCDAVIGWSWLTFGTYDFVLNPLGFSSEILLALSGNYNAIKDVVYADAIGCDFHKVGWAPYNCSLFMYRDKKEFETLMLRPGSDYLQERTTYNPGLYTLEVSRSGAYSMAGWASLKLFGYEGFQVILGGILEMSQHLRDIIKKESTIVCVNEYDHGFVTLFRVYPKGINAEDQYKKELTNPSLKEDLIKHNDLQGAVANKLWEWFRTPPNDCRRKAHPYISYSTGFRPTEYNPEEKDPEAMIYALKSFPMNVNIVPASMDTLIEFVLLARDEICKDPNWDQKPNRIKMV